MEDHWLDFSGAPPMLIPERLAGSWNGIKDPHSGELLELNFDELVTDYDRACAATKTGNGILEFMGSSVLVLYTEHDLHSWSHSRQMVACGGGWPSNEELQRAPWIEPMEWVANDSDFFLMNSASIASEDLQEDDYMPVSLTPGVYIVDCQYGSPGFFYRFRLKTLSQSK